MSKIKTSIKSVDDTISVCLNNNLTFAAYRIPNQTEKVMMIQKSRGTQELADLSKVNSLKGFIVAPFVMSEKNRMFLIQPDFYFTDKIPVEQFQKIEEIKFPADKSKSIPLTFEVSKAEYIQQIEEIIKAIKKGRIQKAVLSRVKLVNNNYQNLVSGFFSKLCDLFPKAFVYVFQTENHFWMGATPEPLAFLKNNVFQTSSVAGTKENSEEYLGIENWGNKEKQEQNFVSDHIEKVLKKNSWDNVVLRGPYVEKAGNILHLRTDFTSSAKSVNGNVGHLLHNLHPTPAVCGTPTKEALEMIFALEKHNREYYGGFIGPVGMENPIMFYMNLRCMKITNSHLLLFAGGGVTIDSNPEDEWQETEIKTGTLLSAIKNRY